MASRRLVPASVRESLLGIPSDIGSLERTYVLPDEDLELIATRRRPDNRLGLAIHIALLRHPGQGWLDGIEPPAPLIAWLAEQVDVSSDALTRYGAREPTRSEHRRLAIRRLGLRAFLRAEQMRAAILLAARSAFDTDDGGAILTRLTTALRTQRFVLPSPVTLERIGLAGRARARRLAAQAINDALDAPHKQALMELLKHDPSLGRSPLTWLRASISSRDAISRSHPIISSSTSNGSRACSRACTMASMVPPNSRIRRPACPLLAAQDKSRVRVERVKSWAVRRSNRAIAASVSVVSSSEICAASDATLRRSPKSLSSVSGATAPSRANFASRAGWMASPRSRGRPSARTCFNLSNRPCMLAALVECGGALGDLATEDPLSLAASRYAQLRRFAPAFLEAFEFDAPLAGRSLQAAVEVLRELNRSGRRKLPDIVPMPFASRQWRTLVAGDAKSARRTYETAVVATLRDRLHAGDVWVEGSRDYRRFDAYLPPANEARQVLIESGIETDARHWLVNRRERLHERLGEVGAKLARGRLEGVRLENARLRITPYDAVTPPAGERLDRAIDALMPRIRITNLLWEVNSRTGFLDTFTDLRSGRVHANRAAILAAVLAGATNLGLERMANASSGVSHAQLSWAHAWYLRPETYADTLARIIDAHHALPFARVCGSTGRTSSDGQFFPSERNAGEINAKYGPDPGLKIYSFLSGRYGSFHSNVIGATAGEAPFVLDGLVGNAAEFDPLVHHVDTGGVSDHVFALFHLIGLSFAPRLRDFPDRRLTCFGRPGRWRSPRSWVVPSTRRSCASTGATS